MHGMRYKAVKHILPDSQSAQRFTGLAGPGNSFPWKWNLLSCLGWLGFATTQCTLAAWFQ